MVTGIEAKIYLIPILDQENSPDWIQTREIPTIHTTLEITGSTITYLKFPLPETNSLLDIRAGGGNLEIAGARIRAQMIHQLELLQMALEKPNPPSYVALELREISQYFSPQDKI